MQKKSKINYSITDNQEEVILKRGRKIRLIVMLFFLLLIMISLFSCKKESSKCYDCAVKLTGNDTIVCGRVPDNVQNCRLK